MSLLGVRGLKLSGTDLDFLVETAFPQVTDKSKLKEIIKEDQDFRNSFIQDGKVFRRVMDDDGILRKISPGLFFEILLRKAASDLEEVGETFEKTSALQIAGCDAKDVVALLTQDSLLGYLAHMLSSFTKAGSHSVSFRAKDGQMTKVRLSDMDIISLKTLSEAVDDGQRLGFYKRIADICLFVLGIFPDYAYQGSRYPLLQQRRPQMGTMPGIGFEDYEREGRRFYKLAAEHKSAKELALSQVFWTLHDHFQEAKKPLNFISQYYLQQKGMKFFAQ
ncbi:MAG: hypothetical protein SWE60_02835 [Thermodesulfobacteriota bacterium]|nr:hypothetical protein [Thermodesulfobacteriota bacterium]